MSRSSGRPKAQQLTYTPRLTQVPYLTNPERNSYGETYLIVHRRGGKSEGAVVCDLVLRINELLALKEIPIIGKDVRLEYPRILYVAETKKQARDIIWPYLIKFLSLFPGVHFNNNSMTVEIPNETLGDFISVHLTAYREHLRVRGTKAYRIYMDEYALCSKEAYSSISSCRNDLKGHILKFGTPMGMDNILYEDMVRHIEGGGQSVWRFPASQTGIFTSDELAKFRQDLGHESYMRDFECDFSISPGLTYWGDQITSLEPERMMSGYNPQWPMVLAADIGVGQSFAAFLGFYIDQERFLLVDYYTGFEAVEELRSEIESQWGRPPDHIILPHDHVRKGMGFRTAFTQRDIFRLAFPQAKFILPPKTAKVEADIQQVKENLHLIWYLSPEAKGTDLQLGVRLVKQYGPKLSPDRVVINKVDKNSRANHPADAFRYMMIGLRMKNGIIGKQLGGQLFQAEAAMHQFPSWARGTAMPRRVR